MMEEFLLVLLVFTLSSGLPYNLLIQEGATIYMERSKHIIDCLSIRGEVASV